MAARKKTPKKEPEEDVYYFEEEGEEEEEEQSDPLPTSIETRVVLDAFDFAADENDPEAEPMYRVSFHAELPEHIAQHLFAKYVQDGRITVEFQPADPSLRRRGTLVRR